MSETTTEPCRSCRAFPCVCEQIDRGLESIRQLYLDECKQYGHDPVCHRCGQRVEGVVVPADELAAIRRYKAAVEAMRKYRWGLHFCGIEQVYFPVDQHDQWPKELRGSPPNIGDADPVKAIENGLAYMEKEGRGT